MRRIVAAFAAILITVSLGVATGSTVVAHERDRSPVTVDPIEPVPFDICDVRPYLGHCRDSATVEPVEPVPFVHPRARARIVMPFPFEPVPFRR